MIWIRGISGFVMDRRVRKLGKYIDGLGIWKRKRIKGNGKMEK